MKKSRAEWEAEIERQESSGLSQTMYAKREGLNVSTLQYWRKKLKSEKSSGGGDGFVDVFSSYGAARSEIELQLPHGIVLRVKGQ